MSRTSPHSSPADTREAVDRFLATLASPLREEVQALRELILGVDATIAEGIKWNAPSFRAGEYFATLHLRQRRGVGVVLHLGAKARALPEGGLAIDDPAGLLSWRGPDRAMVVFADAADIAARGPAFAALLGQWVRYV